MTSPKAAYPQPFSVFGGVIQSAVVRHIDVELGRGTVTHFGSSHGKGASDVRQSRGSFVDDFGPSRLFDQIRGQSAALDHETGHHSMEDGAIVEFIINIS